MAADTRRTLGTLPSNRRVSTGIMQKELQGANLEHIVEPLASGHVQRSRSVRVLDVRIAGRSQKDSHNARVRSAHSVVQRSTACLTLGLRFGCAVEQSSHDVDLPPVRRDLQDRADGSAWQRDVGVCTRCEQCCDDVGVLLARRLQYAHATSVFKLFTNKDRGEASTQR